MSEWMCRVALESVGQTVLGYSFDPLDSPHNNPYTSAIKELMWAWVACPIVLLLWHSSSPHPSPTIFSLSLVRQFAPFLSKLGPTSFRRKVVEWTPNAAVQKVKRMSDVMHHTAQEILRQKRKDLANEGLSYDYQAAKDIISVLREYAIKHLFNFINRFQSVQTITLTKRRNWAILNWLDRWRTCPCDVLAFIPTWLPSRVLIFGAQDTTSSALSRILHLLSVNPEVQSKLRDEIELALKDSDERLDYDTVMALPWLDAVLKETLRLRVLISLFLTLLTLLTYVQ